MFDYLPEEGDHACVMGGESLLQSEAELGEPQRLEILLAELAGCHGVHDVPYAAGLLIGGQLQPRPDALLDGLIAAGAGEDEVDAGQHVHEVKLIDHVSPAWTVPLPHSSLRPATPTMTMVMPLVAGLDALLSGLVQLGQPGDQTRVDLWGLPS